MNERAQDVFEQTVELTGEKRSKAVSESCGDDSQLRREVESLLAAHDEAGDFMSEPTLDRVEGYSAPAEEAGTTIGRYKLLEKIGSGGFGDVFMAQQFEPVKRRVALKIIKLGMDTKQVVARFEAERQALALMDHPNIASVLDGGETVSGRPYFVMELVRGDPITQYCDRERVPTKERLKLFQQVCDAIQHAHQKGVIHRDIKPNNVLITVADGKPLVKVIDFGIAKATNTELTEKTLFTEFRQLIGTPQYMSPEQAERSGVDIDTRSDIYSLGVLLYEMLTGQTPVDMKKMKTEVWEELQRMIREEEPKRPSTMVTSMGADSQLVAKQRGTDIAKLGKALKGDLDWIVLKALEKDRTRRYGTATELSDDVQRYLDDEAVTATPPSTPYRLKKLVRKHRTAIGIATAIAASLLLGIVATSLMAVRAQRMAIVAQKESDEAQRARQEAVEAAEELNKQRKRMVRLAALYSSPGTNEDVEFTSQWLQDIKKAELTGLDPKYVLEQKCLLAPWWFRNGGGEDAAKMIEDIYDDAKRELGTADPVFTGLVNAHIVSHLAQYSAGKTADLFGDLVESMRANQPEGFGTLLPQYAAALASAGRFDAATGAIDEYLEIRNGSRPNPQAAGLESMRLQSALGELRDWGQRHPDRMQRLRELRDTLSRTGRQPFSVVKPAKQVGARQVWEGKSSGSEAER